MDLFDCVPDGNAPLAERMRPVSLAEFIGQEHIVGEGSLLRRAIAADRLGSCVFYGPPGTGKTTLAGIIAAGAGGHFEMLNAVSSGVADAKKVIAEARDRLLRYGKRTYLLLDECHRWNKAQSDSVLSAMEKGYIVFIGSTTENPFVSMTRAIISRCRVFEFRPLTEEQILKGLKRAVSDKRGLLDMNVECEEKALEHIAATAGGDLRVAYNALELAALTTLPDKDLKIRIDVKTAEESVRKRMLSIDESDYYDMLSAFCKSLRGSDSDAGVYWAMRLVDAGCDPMLIFRRILAHSAEDIGMADPQALVVATGAVQAYERLGLPEGKLPLCEAIIYLCECEKSNSVLRALTAAERAVKTIRSENVPEYLKDPAYKGAKITGYKYPHDFGGYVEQQYLPDELKNERFYRPGDKGYEKTVRERRERLGKKDT